MKAKLLELEQGSPEWLSWRAVHGMASEAAALMSEAKYEPVTPLQLYEVKKGLRRIQTSDAMVYGSTMEPHALRYVEALIGYDLKPACVELEHLGASLDGWNEDNEIGVEVKCPYKQTDSTTFKLAQDEKVPTQYEWQLQHQMLVTGQDAFGYCVYVEDHPIFFWVRRNDDMIAELRDAWTWFMERLENDDPPEPGERDIVYRDDGEFLEAAVAWRYAKQNLTIAQETEKTARQTMIDLAGEQSCENDIARVSRYYVQGRVNYKNIPQLQGLDLNQYRGGGQYQYRLTLKEGNDDE